MLPLPIYRAEALTATLEGGEPQQARATVRFPVNVPYVVDNLWEVLRPGDMPSRRHALYASPTRALARQNRSGRDQGRGYCLYQLEIDGAAAVAQLQIPDARRHPDVKAAQTIIQSFAQAITSAALAERSAISLLFLPGASAADWDYARSSSAIADRLAGEMIRGSTFWLDALRTPVASSNGELFLQLAAGSTYRPVDLESYSLD